MCIKCREAKPLTAFSPEKRRKDGYCSKCKACRAAEQRLRKAKPGVARESWLLMAYGITSADYQRLLEAQDGHCACCPAMTRWPGKGLLVVDHDHLTGEVRGLLCEACNHMISKSRDRSEVLAAAAQYLTEPTASKVTFTPPPWKRGFCRSGRHRLTEGPQCRECCRERQRRYNANRKYRQSRNDGSRHRPRAGRPDRWAPASQHNSGYVAKEDGSS